MIMRSTRQSVSYVLVAFLAAGSALTAAACNSAEPTAVAATPAAERLVDVPAIKVGVTDLESTLQISGNLAPQTRVAIMAKLPRLLRVPPGRAWVAFESPRGQ